MTALQKSFKSIRTILSKEQTEILETAMFLMIPALLTKLTGQFFNLLAASYFGTKDHGWNQFLIASSIPDMLSNTLIAGMIGSIIIPSLVQCLKKDGKEAFYRLYSSTLNMFLIGFGVLAIILIAGADWIFPFLLNNIIHPKVYPTQAEIGTIVNMMRVLLIPQIILGISVFISSGLNMYNRYIIPQLAPLFYNIGRIMSIFVLVPLMNYSPWAIVLGVIIGSILHLVIQIPYIKSLGIQYRFVLDFRDRHLREIFKISLPRIFALSSENIALTINDFLAYGISLDQGIAVLNYANSLSLVVPYLFAYTFAYASFTKLSEHFADKDYASVHSIIIKTLNEILFLAMPVIVTLLILRIPVVRLAFGLLPNTRLDLDGTYQIAWVLLWFAVGHIFVCGKWFMYRVFYAQKNTMVPFIVSFISLILNYIFAILFSNLFSHNSQYAITNTSLSISNLFTRDGNPAAVGGIALGMSIAYSIEFFLLLIIFNWKTYKIDFKLLYQTTMKKFIAGGVMFVVMYFMYKIWNIVSYALPNSTGIDGNVGILGSTTLNLMALTIVTVITCFLVYYATCLLLKVEELKILKKYLNPIFRLGGIRIK